MNEVEKFAMWNYYSGLNKGIAIVTTPKRLLKNLEAYRIKPEYEYETIRYGKVTYINYEQDAMISKFGFLTPYLHKRKNYEYEKEFRLIVSMRIASEYGVQTPKEGVNVNLNIEKGINKILLSPNSDENDYNTVQELLDKYDLNLPIEYSQMTKKPKF